MNEDDVVIERDGSEELGTDEELLSGKAGDEVAKLKSELARSKEEKQEYLDGWQRAKADYVNVLKRIDDEKASSFTKGIMTAASPLIEALDTVAHAQAQGHVPADFEPVVKQLHKAVETLGLVTFGLVGEAFDPILHDGLGQDPVAKAELDHTITAVLQPGWKYKETVLRPARVRVGVHT